MKGFIIRWLARLLSLALYRFRARGRSNIPSEGSVLLVCNHVSFVDAILLMAACPRAPRFIMYHRIFKTPVLGWFFRWARAIPIAPRGEDAEIYEKAFERASSALARGEIVAIFPEGMLTLDGEVAEFKGGYSKILEMARAKGAEPVVVPMALEGLWGSFFSRAEGGRAMVKPFRRGAFNRVKLTVGAPVPMDQAQPPALRERVLRLMGKKTAA